MRSSDANAIGTLGWTAVAMAAFAANSVLCRLALRDAGFAPAAFTALRLLSGAAVLGLLTLPEGRLAAIRAGRWPAALALFAYAAAFSWAYVSLSAGTGALLLFGAVQATMIAAGLRAGERLRGAQWFGLGAALAGLVTLLLPGVSAPPWQGALLMVAAGVAWGTYSLLGRGQGAPVLLTAGNFLRTAPLAVALALPALGDTSWRGPGVVYALLSGALTSGLGYVVWYRVLPRLSATGAATVQLSVPVLAAFGGVLFLHEAISPRLLLAAVAVLGGIALVLRPAKTRS